MADDPQVTGPVEEFLRLRRSIGDDTSVLDKFDEQLRGMVESDPSRAADILHALARSTVTDDRDVAAIYVTLLLAARQDQAKDIIRLLLIDPDDDIRRQAQDSLDEAVEKGLITATEAARLIASQNPC